MAHYRVAACSQLFKNNPNTLKKERGVINEIKTCCHLDKDGVTKPLRILHLPHDFDQKFLKNLQVSGIIRIFAPKILST